MKLEIFGFNESGTGGGVVLVSEVLHERSLRGVSSEVCWERAVRAWFHAADDQDFVICNVALDMPRFFE